jgi:hypothetical protein
VTSGASLPRIENVNWLRKQRGGRPARGQGFGVPADQVAEVGNGPVGAGLDEPVIVELLQVSLNDVGLFRDHREQGAQRLARLGVAPADVLCSSSIWPWRR